MKPSIGRIVHYVQKNAWGTANITLPAMIVSVSSDTCVNLQVFTDGLNSDDVNVRSLKWVTSVTLDESETPQPRTWHWPPKV